MSVPPGMIPPPPPPNMAEIPLPPGMTLPQFQTLQKALITIAITTAVSFGVMVWEYVNKLPDEIRVYQSTSRDLWRTPASYAFVVLRYSGLIATFPALFFTSIQSDHCQVAVVLSQVGVILVVAASGIIFCYRVFAIWSGNQFVYALVSLVYAGMLACWIVVAAQYRSTNGPPTPFGSNCIIHPIVAWAPICNASSVLFDFVILLLTIFKVNNNKGSRVSYLLYRDSLVYFSFTAITNTVVLVIQAQTDPVFTFIKPAILPFSTVITATMGVRVFLNLRLLNQRENPDMSATSRSTSHDRHNLKSGTGSVPSHPSHPSGIPMQTMVISTDGATRPRPGGPFYSGVEIKGIRNSDDYYREP